MAVITTAKRVNAKSPNEPYLDGEYTVEEFHELWERKPYRKLRLELVEGEVFEMPTTGPDHDLGVGLLDYALKARFQAGYWVRVQSQLALGAKSNPLPDIAVIEGEPRRHAGKIPSTALLVVEISDTTLEKDTRKKGPMYAAAGIADYWVVDVDNRRLIVHRKPVADESERSGFRYSDITTHAPGEAVSPLAKPDAVFQVLELLP